MKKVLIIGGGGFIGFHLSKYLAEKGYDVTIIDNFENAEKDSEFDELIKKEKVKFIEKDITLTETFNDLNEEFDYVYHLAAVNGTPNFYDIPDRVIKVGAVGTINVLDWFVRTQKNAKLLFSSSSENYAGALDLMGDKFPIPTPENVPLVVDNPSNVRWSYGSSKILGEVAFHSYAKSKGLKDFVIIRYHNVYGPRMGNKHVVPNFIERILKNEDPFKIYGGEETRTFNYISDAVIATILSMEKGETNNQTVNIGRDDDEIKIVDLAKTLFEVAGVNPVIELNPAPRGCVMRRCPDISKLKNLGFSCKISLKEGLEETFNWYKNKRVK